MNTRTGQTLLALVLLFVLGNMLVGVGVTAAYAQASGEQAGQAAAEQPQQARKAPAGGAQRGTVAIAIAISIGAACAGAGYAVGRVGSAAIGAASENPEMLTRSLIFVALAEGIAIYGLLVAILLWIKF